MRGQLRDAKIAYAIEKRPRAPKEITALPWQGFFAFFRSILGEPVPTIPRKRRWARWRRKQEERRDFLRRYRQRGYEAKCDARFREMQLASRVESQPAGQLRRHWKPEWLHAEALAMDAKRTKHRALRRPR